MDFRLTNVIKSKKAIVLLGAGVSIATSGDPLSGWNGLLCHALALCKRHFPDQLDDKWLERRETDLREGTVFDKMNIASQVMHWLNKLGQENYPRWVEATIGTLTVKHPALIQAIGALNVPILTTNYDTLIEKVLNYDLATWEQQETCSQIIKGKKKGVLHVHGCWKNPPTMILDFNSYQQIQADDFIQTLMRNLEYNHSIIFVGFGSGMEDPHFQGFLTWAKGKFLNPQTQHYILVKADDIPKGLPDNIIPIVYGSRHEELTGFLEQLAPKKKKPRVSRKSVPPKKREGVEGNTFTGLEAFISGLVSASQHRPMSPLSLHSAENFLLHTSSNLELARDITLLCVLPYMDRSILTAYWLRQDVARKLKELTAQCSFINGGEIAAADRMLFRHNWSKHRDPIVKEVLQQLETILEKLQPPEFNSSDYFNWYLQFFNLQSWKLGAGAVPDLVKGLLMGVLAEADCQPLLDQAKELLAIYREETTLARFLEHNSFDQLSCLELRPEDLLFLEHLPIKSWMPLEKVCLYLVLGYVYYRKADYRMAVHYFDGAFTLSDDFFPQGNLLAKAYLDAVSAVLGHTDDAALRANCLQWIDKFNFQSYDLCGELAGIYHNAKQYDRAIEYWKQYLDVLPEDVTVWHLLLRTLSANLHAHQRAIAAYATAPYVIQQVPFIMLLIGSCYEVLEDYTAAETYYKQVMVHPSATGCDAMRMLAELYADKIEHPGNAYIYYDKAMEAQGSSYAMTEVGVSYLSFLMKERQHDKALSLLLLMEQPLNYNYLSMSADMLNTVAWDLYLLNTRLDLAEKLSRRSVELKGHVHYAIHTLAVVLVRLKEWKEAAHYLERWLQMSPGDVMIYDWSEYILLFKDIVLQGKQVDAEELLAGKASPSWLALRWAIYKTTPEGQKATIPEDIARVAQAVYRQLIGRQSADKFPE